MQAAEICLSQLVQTVPKYCWVSMSYFTIFGLVMWLKKTG